MDSSDIPDGLTGFSFIFQLLYYSSTVIVCDTFLPAIFDRYYGPCMTHFNIFENLVILFTWRSLIEIAVENLQGKTKEF